MHDQPDKKALTALCLRAREQTLHLLAKAAGHFGRDMPRPDIRFDLRGKTAGQARTRDGRTFEIRYNIALLARHGDELLARTVPHEAAHVVAFCLYGTRVRPHGREWQAIMRLFGAEPSRCHDYDVQGLQTRALTRYSYRCSCRTHELTSIRHKRVLAGQVYLCRRCGEALRRDEDEKKT